jgi:hypothetical protein
MTEINRDGIEVDVDAYSKDGQHLEPHVLDEAFSIRRHTHYDDAIKAGFKVRGETRFDIPPIKRRLAHSRTWKLGQAWWRAAQNLADDVDLQLYYRWNGVLRARPWPDNPSWVFRAGDNSTIIGNVAEHISVHDVINEDVVRGQRTVKVQVQTETKLENAAKIGDTSIKIDSAKDFAVGRKITIGGRGDAVPEVRTISGSYTPGSKTVPFSGALTRNHGVGAPVSVRHREDRPRAVVGRAQLEDSHPLSAETLTDGKRPRVEIEDLPRIHRKKKAEEKAIAKMDRRKVGVEVETSITTTPIWHLELGDVVRVDDETVQRHVRVQRYTKRLHLDGEMTINHVGTRVPTKHRKRRHGKGRH